MFETLSLRASLRFAVVAALCVVATCVPALAALREGDTVSVTVYNHPDLSKTLRVDTSGNITVPLAGVIPVRGRSEAEVAGEIERALRRYVVRPAVEVSLTSEGTAIFVAGGGGGVLTYQPGETLVSAISEAQRSQVSADARLDTLASLARMNVDYHRVGLQRDGRSIGVFDTVQLAREGRPGPALQPGDTIVLGDKPKAVRVEGAVMAAGTTYLSADQRLGEAVVQTGGLDTTAATAHVIVHHDGRAYDVALGDPLLDEPASDGDSIFVPTAPRVAVDGDVGTPGQTVLRTDDTLLTALSQAGGVTRYANITYVTLERRGVQTHYDITKLVHGDLTQNPHLADGDVVVVPDGHKIDYALILQALALPIAAVTKF